MRASSQGHCVYILQNQAIKAVTAVKAMMADREHSISILWFLLIWKPFTIQFHRPVREENHHNLYCTLSSATHFFLFVAIFAAWRNIDEANSLKEPLSGCSASLGSDAVGGEHWRGWEGKRNGKLSTGKTADSPPPLFMADNAFFAWLGGSPMQEFS